MIPLDTHSHSTHSPDGHDPVERICGYAVQKGITHLSITEHVDGDYCHPQHGFFNYERYSDTITRAQRQFPELTILKGIEFGEAHIAREAFAHASSLELDLIIGSVHRPGMVPLTDTSYRERYTTQEIFEIYFEEAYRMVEHGGFDVLGHLDLPVRYLFEGYAVSHTLEKLLKLCIRQEIVPEINTSSMRRGYKELMPSADTLALYADCGGRYIACGSDAHHARDIAADYDSLERVVSRFNLVPVYFKDRTLREMPFKCCV
ncbi:MAG: histidinol-phosphatase HisJ family protein [Spirochaetota bacterium]